MPIICDQCGSETDFITCVSCVEKLKDTRDDEKDVLEAKVEELTEQLDNPEPCRRGACTNLTTRSSGFCSAGCEMGYKPGEFWR